MDLQNHFGAQNERIEGVQESRGVAVVASDGSEVVSARWRNGDDDIFIRKSR